MFVTYPACFYEEKEGGYSVIFPDLNHLATQGDTLEEAMKMAIDCMAGYLYLAKRSGEDVPKPSKSGDINVDDEYDDYKSAFVNLVAVDVEDYAKSYFEKPVKKTLSIPKWLNDEAVARQINFSSVLQKALLQELHMT